MTAQEAAFRSTHTCIPRSRYPQWLKTLLFAGRCWGFSPVASFPGRLRRCILHRLSGLGRLGELVGRLLQFDRPVEELIPGDEIALTAAFLRLQHRVGCGVLERLPLLVVLGAHHL